MIWDITIFFIGVFVGALYVAIIKGGTKGDEDE